MTETSPLYILGSRSPRRLELLSQIVPASRIRQRPPSSAEELDFEGLHSPEEIQARVLEIARMKRDDVARQVPDPQHVLVAADTTVIARDEHDRPLVLGQPPEQGAWQPIVREWFTKYLAGRTHVVATAVCLRTQGRDWERIVETRVTFRPDVERWLDWYLATGESRGRAGGYSIQGAASLFVELIDGSLSNVIGLPVEAVIEGFEALGIDWQREIPRFD